MESLLLQREKLDMPAIYFIEPSEESVRMFIEDYKDKSKPQYSAIHLFFSTRMFPRLLPFFRKGVMARRIRLNDTPCSSLCLAYLHWMSQN